MTTGREPWLPDEVAGAGRENLDPGHVARYDEKEDANADAEIALLRTLDLPARPVVVDLGAGTGQFSLAAAGWASRVVAADVSPVMLEHLRTKVGRSGAANVECVQAGFLTYEHAGARADLVYSRYALHHLPDFWKAVALHRIARVVRPGGVLRLCDIVYSFDAGEATGALERWMDEHPAASADDAWTRGDVEEHVRDEHSTFTWLLEPMVRAAGFAIEQAQYSDNQVVASYVCRRT